MLDCVGQPRHHLLVAAEVGEVFEREIEGADEHARGAECTQFVVLSLAAGHALTMRPRAERPLLRR